MIIHVFNNKSNFVEELLPAASSMYPLNVDGKTLGNVISEYDSWTIQLTDEFHSPEAIGDSFKLQLYQTHTIVSKKTHETFYVVGTESYYQQREIYKAPREFLVGSSEISDIYYHQENNNKDLLKLSLTLYGWVAETTSTNFFASRERIVGKKRLACGDFIFYFGLKIILLNNAIIINSPTDKIKIGPKMSPTKIDYASAGETKNAGKNESDPDIDAPFFSEDDYYYKTPRFNYITEPTRVTIDEPPAPRTEEKLPAILTVGPQVTMAITSALSIVAMIMFSTQSGNNAVRIRITITVMAVSMIGALVWPTLTRSYNRRKLKKREQKRQTKYREYLAKKQKQIEQIKADQSKVLIDNNPPIEQCAQIIETKNNRLWQRNIEHKDFLCVRVGTGNVDTEIMIDRPEDHFSLDDEDPLFIELKKVVDDSLHIENAPLTYNFTNQIIDAVMGLPELTKPFMDSIFLQMLTFYSYTDLKIVVFTTEPEKWSYLKTAPHCWNNERTVRYFATSIEKLSSISLELEKIFDARKANDEEEKLEDNGEKKDSWSTFRDFRPYYLLFIDDMSAVRNISLINKVLHYKRNLGFSIIATAQSVSMLPSETADFISVTKDYAAILTTGENEKQINFKADLNNGIVDMKACTRKLANIPVKAERGKFELPKSLPFLEMYDCGRVEQLNSLARWKNNDPTLSLSVPIGIDQNNECFRMDAHEKAYGPHGLIAGTTGSGKSEWIITFILSLAVNYSPEEVQFVLIDYKGGGLAKSFENAELGIKLPHLAGTITNLDKSEIFRSISAIESELKRRQTMFNNAREKLKEGSMDIYKYQGYYRKGLVSEPMSHLFIICDEFAELKAQQPDFMDQLVSTSRIGRSLGVHLILATQKPSGVVNDQIWSNSKFRVALKVQNRSDSNDVIKRPDAAYLKQVGSFYLQVGNDDYFNLGQVAWAGAKYYPSNSMRKQIDGSVQLIDDIGHVVNTVKDEVKVESQGEQLLNIVGYLSDISKKVQLHTRQMWLKNIQPKMLLADLREKYNAQPSGKYTYSTIIGEYDEPRLQKQDILRIDLAGGNIAIAGKPDGSIDQLLSTIIWSSICDHTPAEIAYYIIDLGAETLRKFAKFPQVGEVVFQSEADKIAGVLSLITDEMENRKKILSEYNGSFEYYNRVEKEKMGLIVVVINNYDIFGELFSRAVGLFNELFRDAPKYGIIFIATANTTSAFGSRILQYFNHYILMQLADDTVYRSLTNCRRGLIPKKAVGRGICKIDADSTDSYCEFQTAMIDDEESELQTIKTYADQCVEYYKCKVKQLAKIPDDITSNDLIKHVSDISNVPLGVDLYQKNLLTYDFSAQKIHLVTSRDINANINFVYALASLLTKVSNVKVRVIDLLKIFRKPILDIQKFEQDPNVVFAALEKDILTRTDSQDYGINIVIGAGKFKEILSAAGVEIFENAFNNLQKSKKVIFILVDNYDSIRNLSVERWYLEANVKQGIWLGQGLDSQSLFDIEVRSEDNKYNFPGLGYVISGDDYDVIKAMMDKDE